MKIDNRKQSEMDLKFQGIYKTEEANTEKKLTGNIEDNL